MTRIQSSADLDKAIERFNDHLKLPSITFSIQIESSKDEFDSLTLQKIKAVRDKIHAECDIIMTMADIDVAIFDEVVE